MVADIDQALLRMKEGSYGECGRCGQIIDERRLEAVPTARYDAACQTLIETERVWMLVRRFDVSVQWFSGLGRCFSGGSLAVRGERVYKMKEASNQTLTNTVVCLGLDFSISCPQKPVATCRLSTKAE